MSNYFTKEPESKFEPNKIKSEVFGFDLEFYTATDVFSKEKIDDRSKLLIENCIIQPDTKVLDFGCGWGAVGISLLKKHENIHFTFTDINLRATKLTQMNLKLNEINENRYNFLDSNELIKLSESNLFDNVLLNPPIMTGRKQCLELIQNSFDYLKKGGVLQIVTNIKVEGVKFQNEMERVFGNCIELSSSKIKNNMISILLSRKLN